jgi:hypothetical protein
MNRQRQTPEAAFVPRRFSPLRILWKSRMWIALALLALGYLLTFHTETTPAYPKVIAFIGGALVGVWRLSDTVSMWRAARSGEIRQAVVTGRDSSNWMSNGAPLVRIIWSDATGVSGRSRLGHAHHFPAPGTRIIVYADPRTGRTWWEEEL